MLENKIKLLEREQYYLDKYKPSLNTLKFAGSSLGFKRIHTEETKLKIAINHFKANPVVLINNKTNDTKEFTSIGKAAEYIGLYHSRSYFAKCLRRKNIYKVKESFILLQIKILNK